MTKTAVYCLAFCASLITVPAWAQTSEAQPPEPDTLILSDTLHYDDIKRESVFTGNVILTRGPLTLRSDKLVTREDADGTHLVTATAAKSGLLHIQPDNPEKLEGIGKES